MIDPRLASAASSEQPVGTAVSAVPAVSPHWPQALIQTTLSSPEAAAAQAVRRFPLHSGWRCRQLPPPEPTLPWRAPGFIDATVPGCNFTDLLAAGLIDDPFLGGNEALLQDIEHTDWLYQRTLSFSAAELAAGRWFLQADGLDTFCQLRLNGQLIGESRNMFVPLRLDLTDQLQEGENQLELLFLSPIRQVRPLQQAGGLVYPAENDKSDDKLSVFVRKAPCHFGWDWGPRLVSSGIWQPIALELVPLARIADVKVQSQLLGSQRDKPEAAQLNWQLLLDLQSAALLLKQPSHQPLQLRLSCALLGTEPLACWEVPVPAQPDAALVPVLQTVQLQGSITLNAPQLWWPNGLGEPFLYPFVWQLWAGDTLLQQHQHAVGLRHIEVVNQADSDGISFYFKVNGVPFFAKGANYIPSDAFPARVSNERLAAEFAAVKAANMNMLRVWGGGYYQPEAFYQLADQHGILIWQDFMFACSLYPASADFMQNVAEEAQYQVARLSQHPSLALWCGNNEVDMGIAWWDWPAKFGYSDSQWQQLKQDYQQLFGELLAQTVQQLDPACFYLRSSPQGFWEDNTDHLSNQHYWGVWHGEAPFSEYARRVPRFMTEYGFQSLPICHSIDKFLTAQQQQLTHPAFVMHQKHPRGTKLIYQYMQGEYAEPADFRQLTYVSQVQQALGLKIAFEAHRAAMPFCMGTLYWQLNDTWPAASWSGIDYYGQYKALHYQAARSYRPQSLVFKQQDDQLQLLLVSDSLQALQARLELRLLDFSGVVLQQSEHILQVSPNRVSTVWQQAWRSLVNGIEPGRTVFVARLLPLQGAAPLAEQLFYFCPPLQQQLAADDGTDPARQLQLQLRPDGVDTLVLRLQSPLLCRQLWLWVETPEALVLNFSDNFFDVLPGEAREVQLSLQGLTDSQRAAVIAGIRWQSLAASGVYPRLQLAADHQPVGTPAPAAGGAW